MPTLPTLKTFAKGTDLPPLTNGKLRLYSMRFCPFAERTRLVLAPKNIDFETVNVHLKQKPEWFLERNPLGLVPVLEMDGKVIYESAITCDYLDDVNPEEKLTPSDPYRKARDKILLEMFGKAIGMYYGLFRSKDEEGKEILEKLQGSLVQFEKTLGERGKFFGDDKPSMLDYMIWPWFERIPTLEAMKPNVKVLPEEKFPNLNGWINSMREHEVVKKILIDTPSHVQFAKSMATGTPDYDFGLDD